jgi:hypothetical protein
MARPLCPGAGLPGLPGGAARHRLLRGRCPAWDLGDLATSPGQGAWEVPAVLAPHVRRQRQGPFWAPAALRTGPESLSSVSRGLCGSFLSTVWRSEPVFEDPVDVRLEGLPPTPGVSLLRGRVRWASPHIAPRRVGA